MDFNLKCFGSENNMGFPKLDMNVWVSENDKNILFNNAAPHQGPEYVRVECKDVLSHFIFYAKIETINPAIALGDGCLWMPKELVHKAWLVSKKTMVNVSVVNYNDAVEAEAITIKLDPELVKNWSDDEIERAEDNVRSSSRIFFDTQMIFIKPVTKKSVIGEVESIYPKTDSRNTLYRLSSSTKINFTGLPIDRQKTIDFSQIGGLTTVINRLREILQIPINYPDILERFGIKPPKGMLLYGPPGNGKTMVARAVAYSMGSSFITIEGPEFMSKYVGVGEQRLREKFEEAESKGNCVIFIDEIDSITAKRSSDSAEYQISIVATLLNLMDGMNSSSKVFVIGATNRLSAIDPALRRPGRFDLEFEIPLPNVHARYDILSKYIKTDQKELFENADTVSLQVLSELTNGYSGADLSLLYRESVMNAIRRNIQIDDETGKIALKVSPSSIKLANGDFQYALKSITPTSLRGVDANKPTVRWDNLIGLDKQKDCISKIYHGTNIAQNSDDLPQRPSKLNIIVEGVKGAGKRTFIYAFAERYNYEVLELDMWDLVSYEASIAYQMISETISKAKQIAPSIIYVTNADKIERSEHLLLKLNNELYKLNKYVHIMTVLSVEDIGLLPQSILGYKAFDTIINVNQSKEDIERYILHTYGENISRTLNMDSIHSIGEAITTITEQNHIKYEN